MPRTITEKVRNKVSSLEKTEEKPIARMGRKARASAVIAYEEQEIVNEARDLWFSYLSGGHTDNLSPRDVVQLNRQVQALMYFKMKANLNLEKTCEDLNINEVLWIFWREQNPYFNQLEMELMKNNIRDVFNMIISNAKQGDGNWASLVTRLAKYMDTFNTNGFSSNAMGISRNTKVNICKKFPMTKIIDTYKC